MSATAWRRRREETALPPPVVGLIPAAGRATQLGEVQYSKEIHPVGGQRLGTVHRTRPKAVCEYLLEAFVDAGIASALAVLRAGKEDIRTHLEELEGLRLEIDYLTIDDSGSVPETVDRARRAVNGRLVAFGFPDVVLRPSRVFRDLLERQRDRQADLVLGLFPTEEDARSDMVDVDDDGKVLEIVVKQPPRGLRYTWMAAVWTPWFTGFLNRFVSAQAAAPHRRRERQIGEVVQAALEDGNFVDSVVFEDGLALDIGTPEGLEYARRTIAR